MLSIEAENDGEDSSLGIADEPHVTFHTLSSSRQRTGESCVMIEVNYEYELQLPW